MPVVRIQYPQAKCIGLGYASGADQKQNMDENPCQNLDVSKN
jgi:hypothetical protein